MIDVTGKPRTLRMAYAIGYVKVSKEALKKIREDSLPKGNLFDVARAAGLIGCKRTPELIPHCHPVALDYVHLDFETLDDPVSVKINCRASSISRTGVEMEALTAVSVAALTIYDLLKPVDKDLEIYGVKLVEKTGGRKGGLLRNKSSKTQEKKTSDIKLTESDSSRSGKKGKQPTDKRVAILVCSDSTAAGEREDRSGKVISETMQKYNMEIADYKIVPDDEEKIRDQVSEWVSQGIPFVFTTGGTGLGPRDVTVEALEDYVDRKVAGIGEAMRAYGQERTLKAMLSRSFAGVKEQTVIVSLPGSSRGAKESLEAVLPELFHARSMILGGGH